MRNIHKIDSNQIFLQYNATIDSILNDYNDFFEVNVKYIVSLFIDNFLLYEERITQFSKDYSRLLVEKEEENISESFDFSIFDIVKFKRKEEHLHSPLLSKLLDTNGTHGQKDLFYKLFLKEILKDEEKVNSFLNANYRDYIFKEEEFIKDDIDRRGEIDLTIKSINPIKKFAIILENKWGSGDSCVDQIHKYYRNFIIKQGYTDDNLLVIYLTKKGCDPDQRMVENQEYAIFLKENKNKNYFPISYSKHIVSWLLQCQIQCQSPKVNFLIEQYIKHIKNDISNRR